MDKFTFDAIVIGSGISGGWAAKELCEKGLKVVMLERGRNIEHIKDYVNAKKDIWELPHYGEKTQQMFKDYPNLSRDSGILNEATLNLWVSEKENPYTEVKPFAWFRGYHLGGRSLMWGRQSYRFCSMDFEANLKEGIGVDWPIRYEEIAPWYSYAEKFAGIQGSKEGLDILPDGEFMRPMEMNIVEKHFSKKIQNHYHDERRMFIGRSANITENHYNRVKCLYRNRCWRGCPYGSYFSTQSATLPAAMQTGNLTLEVFKIVTKILYDKNTKKAIGVEVLDALTNLTYTYKAKIIFLNASTFNSAWILMNSATEIWEGGLGSSSGELGHNIMDHHFKIGATCTVEGFEDKVQFGRRPTGIYIPRFRNVEQDKRDYLRGFGYQGAASRGRNTDMGIAELTIGVKLKEFLSEPGAWTMGISAFGEVLPDHRNRIFLDKKNKDKWGLPTLAMDAELKENEKKMRIDMKNDAIEMLTVAGGKNVAGFDTGYVLGMGIHEMGTARMGRDPKTSVLNKYNQVWDALNVFVTDGACMTSSSCVNPSLTYMALTARACDFAVNELKKGNL